ncbi:hypothetical protein C8R46DRAFT_1223112 [Mycena filopes]|nr:hypothetical protein C8R46DRAFT_1223112 [Mycena filopes]
MSTQQNPAADPSRWVLSRKGAFFWRHASQSFWKGEPDDRVWVPSMDTPPDMPPPPDIEQGPPRGPAPSATTQNVPTAPNQFGTSTTIPARDLTTNRPPAYQREAPTSNNTTYGHFSTPSPFTGYRRREGAPHMQGAPPAPSPNRNPYGGYSAGPFANSFRINDE